MIIIISKSEFDPAARRIKSMYFEFQGPSLDSHKVRVVRYEGRGGSACAHHKRLRGIPENQTGVCYFLIVDSGVCTCARAHTHIQPQTHTHVLTLTHAYTHTRANTCATA